MPHIPLRRAAALVVTAAAVGAGTVAVSTVVASPAAAAPTPVSVVQAAAAYGRAHGYTVGISVHDSRTHRVYSAGRHASGFASESIIKVMIATRLLVQGRMHGATSARAYRMITQSDDNIATSFYGSVGGDGLLGWIKARYHLPWLGTGPIRSGWWGSNRITSDGLVQLYAKLHRDPKVGRWLLNAMHGHTRYGADGFYQAFGLPSASRNVGVKQGWGGDYSYSVPNASMNSTGFVNGNRYAVAILARGPAGSYGGRLGAAITTMARILLPHGVFPDVRPKLMTLSRTSGPTRGGTFVRLHGRYLATTRAVYLGSRRVPFRVETPSVVLALAPANPPQRVRTRIVTSWGTAYGPWYTYVDRPWVTAIAPSSGPEAGGTVVTLTGKNYARGTTRVYFGSLRAPSVTWVSGDRLRVTAPAGGGRVHIKVVTPYGVSLLRTNDLYTYVPAQR